MTSTLITGVGVDLPSGASLDRLLAAALDRGPILADAPPGPTLTGRGPGYPGQDRPTAFAIAASLAAIGTDGLGEDGARVGVLVASTTSNIDTIVRVASGVAATSYRVVAPSEVLTIAGTQVTASLSSWFDARAFAYGSCTGNAAGLDALALASMALRLDRARTVLVVGTESPGESAARMISESDGERPLFSGGVAVVTALPDPDPRRNGVAIAVAPVVAAETTDQLAPLIDVEADLVGLVLIAAGTDAERRAQAERLALWFPGAALADVWPVLGDSQGALGLLQCALAVTWLEDHPGQRAVVVAGSISDRHLVATVLSRWGDA